LWSEFRVGLGRIRFALCFFALREYDGHVTGAGRISTARTSPVTISERKTTRETKKVCPSEATLLVTAYQLNDLLFGALWKYPPKRPDVMIRSKVAARKGIAFALKS